MSEAKVLCILFLLFQRQKVHLILNVCQKKHFKYFVSVSEDEGPEYSVLCQKQKINFGVRSRMF